MPLRRTGWRAPAASRDRRLGALVWPQSARTFAQDELLHFPRRCARQFGDDLEPFGPILLGDLTGVEIMLHASEIERQCGAKDDEGAGPLTQTRIRHRDDRDVRDRGMVGQELLDFGNRNLFAAAVDDVAHAPRNADISRFVHHAEIAGAEPTVGSKGGGRPIRMVDVSFEHRRRCYFEVSFLAGWKYVSVSVGNAQTNASQRSSVG